MQLAVLPWGALNRRTWGALAATLPAPEVARLLGAFPTLVMTPVGGGAATGLQLMAALRPPTHAVNPSWRRSRSRASSAAEPVDRL